MLKSHVNMLKWPNCLNNFPLKYVNDFKLEMLKNGMLALVRSSQLPCE